MPNPILVPLDGSKLSEEVIPFAVLMAKATDRPLALLLVVEGGGPDEEVGYAHRHLVERMLEKAKEDGFNYLSGVVERLKDDGMASAAKIVVGLPAQTIVEEAGSLNAGMIAMSTHGRSGLARWTLGSVAEAVLRTAGCPLLVHRATGKTADGTFGSVLLPLDGSPAAERAIPLAVSIATTLGIPVTAARSVPTCVFAFSDEGAALSVAVLEAAETETREYLDRKDEELKRLGVRVESRSLRGEPASALIDLAQELPHCLVIMSTAGRTGVGRIVLGSVADRVVRHARRPVLLVRAG